MTKKKEEYKLTPFWKEITDIIERIDFQEQKIEPNGDFILYRKIINFLYKGAAGTLFEIKEALGEEQLNNFLDYVRFYLENYERPGHYYPSKLVKKQIKEVKQTKNLFDLSDTLNEISKLEFEKHGNKKAKGWLPNES